MITIRRGIPFTDEDEKIMDSLRIRLGVSPTAIVRLAIRALLKKEK